MKLISSYLRLTTILLTLLAFFSLGITASANVNTSRDSVKIVDFDGNGKTDVTLFDRADSRWFIYDFYLGTQTQYDIGMAGGTQVVGDYDGDGVSDFAVCYDDLKTGLKMWRVSYSMYGPRGDQHWGSTGDIPVPADYDGDGVTDRAVFRPDVATWYIQLSKTGVMRSEKFGYSSDRLVPADYDGDGLADIAVMRPIENAWYIHLSSDDSVQAIDWMATSMIGDQLTPADFDGDGRADLAVYRRDSGFWIILESSTESYRFAQFGNGIYTGDPTQAEVSEKNLDLPMPGDFDGDGIIDIGVWNAKTRVVNVLPSSSSIMTSQPVGNETSIPVTLLVISNNEE